MLCTFVGIGSAVAGCTWHFGDKSHQSVQFLFKKSLSDNLLRFLVFFAPRPGPSGPNVKSSPDNGPNKYS